MQYGGNLDSENPVFFESISSAIDAIQIHRVRLTSRSRWSLEGFLDAHSNLLKAGKVLFTQWTFYVEIFYLSVIYN